MRAEDSVPVDQRMLKVVGRASASWLGQIGTGLPAPGPDDVPLAFHFAYADLPMGKRFDCCVTVEGVVRTDALVVAVSQQFGKPFDEIPHGWKTITMLRFSPEVPKGVRDLPEVEDWWARQPSMGLCTSETWEAAGESLTAKVRLWLSRPPPGSRFGL